MQKDMWSIVAIIQKNVESGQSFFSEGARRFFESKTCPEVYQGHGGVYFITSERFMASDFIDERRYTVRAFNPETGHVSTVGPFNELTKERAIRMAIACAYGVQRMEGI